MHIACRACLCLIRASRPSWLTLVFVLLVLVPPALAEISYEVAIEGVEGDLKDLLEQQSDSLRLLERLPDTRTVLRHRAEDDVERFGQVLRAEGYYASEVVVDLSGGGDAVKVTFQVTAGPQYPVTMISLDYAGGGVSEPLTYGDLGLLPGAPARSEDILAAEQRAIEVLRQRAHPWAVPGERKVWVDHDARAVGVTYRIDAGPAARFGPADVSGLDEVARSVVLRELAWRAGEPFDSRKLAQTRRALTRTGLFESISVDYPEQPVPGPVPVTIAVREAEHQRVGAGARFSTSEGFGVRTYYEHANLLGEGEQLRLESTLAEQRMEARSTLRMPAFGHRDQALRLTANAAQERFDAYDARRYGASAILERRFGDLYAGSAGTSLERLIINEGDEEDDETFDLLGLPLTLTRDSSDDLLNPTEGSRLSLAGTPYVGIGDAGTAFVSLRASATAYQQLDPEQRFVLAVRAIAGTILGESRGGVPADKRFYAGGGDSIRGYGFQLVGPLDEENEPLGGRSVLAGSLELRGRITDTIGGVLFVDGGSAFEASTPDSLDEIRYAVGGGFRYFTPVGPLRVDIAVPLDKREVDDDFQLYVSLGQAF